MDLATGIVMGALAAAGAFALFDKYGSHDDNQTLIAVALISIVFGIIAGLALAGAASA